MSQPEIKSDQQIITRKERRDAQRSKNRVERYSPKHILRNLLLGGTVLSLSLLIAVGICNSQPDQSQFVNDPQHIFIDKPETIYRFGAFTYDTASNETDPLDINYLQSLINTLHSEQGDRTTRAQSVARHFTHVGNSSGGMASALQIDESGIYLTAAHVLTDEAGNLNPNKIYAHTPFVDSRAFQANSVVATDWDTDIAIFYAPTGKPRKPVENIQLKDEPAPDETLWLLGTPGVNRNYTFIGILRGVFDPSVNFTRPGKNLLPVRGMIPFGGSSGGPVIDREGRVVAVESGTLWEGPNPSNERNKYKGASVAGISHLKDLLSRPVRLLKNIG